MANTRHHRLVIMMVLLPDCFINITTSSCRHVSQGVMNVQSTGEVCVNGGVMRNKSATTSEEKRLKRCGHFASWLRRIFKVQIF
jgi:hypothetical protein